MKSTNPRPPNITEVNETTDTSPQTTIDNDNSNTTIDNTNTNTELTDEQIAANQNNESLHTFVC